jgi:hypothetical protein
VPFDIAPIPHVMLWSARQTNEPSVLWLRRLLGPLLLSVFTDEAR